MFNVKITMKTAYLYERYLIL